MRSPIINVMDRAARRAGRALARDFGEAQQLQVSRKGPDKFVAAALRRIDKILRDELAKARPGFVFRDNRQGAGDGDQWLLCPLDGTTNFLHGQPHFAISIAHASNGTMIEGIVYDPLRDELFWAVRNTGAYLNDTRLRVSARRQLHECVIAAQDATAFAAIAADTAGVRCTGAPALDLAYVAAGRFDAAWHHGLPANDVAAGILLVREAGGFVTDAAGGDGVLNANGTVAANDQVHEALLKRARAAASNAAT